MSESDGYTSDVNKGKVDWDRVLDEMVEATYPENEKVRIPIMGKNSSLVKQTTPIKPTHYNGNKCMEIISEVVKDKPADEGFIIGNVIKYVFRYDKKGGVEDIKKAREYLTMLVEILEKK